MNYMRKLNRKNKPLLILFIFFTGFYSVLFLHSISKPFIPQLKIQESIKYWLHDSANNIDGNIKLNHILELDSLYMRNNYYFIWFDQYKLTQHGIELLNSLKHTSGDYWKTYGYRVRRLEYDLKKIFNSPKKVAALDILLSDAYISYSMQSLNKELLPDNGELDHPSFSQVKSNQTHINSLDSINLLSQSIKENKLLDLIKSFTPQHIGYKLLSKELDRYQKIVDSQQWYPLIDLYGAKLGDTHKEIPRLRWMLNAYGDISVSNERLIDLNYHYFSLYYDISDPAYLFDESIKYGIKKFQERHEIDITGVIDDKTFKKLNTHPYFISQKIALNMKRWRYLPKNLGNKHILVNMANYSLSLVENNNSILDMKVIIGKQNRRTPVMTSKIGSVILAPEWNVPHRIAINDIVPKIKNDPHFLINNNFKVFEGWSDTPNEISPENINIHGFYKKKDTYRLVQSAGSYNSLGFVKFVIPNDKSIYLHDTNKKELFSYKNRALSSGCIRVEKPLELAKHLINNKQWNLDKIKEIISKKQQTLIYLNEEIPVHLMYWTSWVNPNGVLQIRDDIYNRDLINKSLQSFESI